MAKKRLEAWADIVDTDTKELPALAGDFAEHMTKIARGGFWSALWCMFHARQLGELSAFYADAYETVTADHEKLVGKAQKTVGILVSMFGGSYSFPKDGKKDDKRD